ncbi:MAG: aldehyde dehydrogenase family protein [Pseudomonadota bacterium]
MALAPAPGETCRSFIAGAWSRPVAYREGVVVDPATEAPICRVPLAEPAEVARAVAAARAAFYGDSDGEEGWREAAPARRLAVLRRLVEAVEARRSTFAALISREMGAPLDFAEKHQVAAGIGHLAATLDAAERAGDDTPVAPDRPADRVRYEPMGVAALITPWNWPLNQTALKVGAALAAGCAMVLKPSERAPLSALLFGEAMEEALARANAEDGARAPAGLFNLVIGDGATGAALAGQDGVDVVSFTGSTRAGRAVAVAAAPAFRRTVLELGGKSPNLLFEDCDLETAIRQGVAHCFRNAGQSCNAASRMLVARPIYARAVALAAAAAEATAVGLPDARGGHIGPQVSAEQHARVQGLIAGAQAEGARLVAGGVGRPEGLARGYFSRPTVFADVAPQMALFSTEVFGPVLAMTPFETEAEAIALANDVPYGLAAFVQTADPVRADRVSSRLRAGMVQVNGRSRAPGAPFGGVKGSGWGREAGIWGIRSLQEVKSISGAAAVRGG